jgi:phage terminase large subunit-like protein
MSRMDTNEGRECSAVCLMPWEECLAANFATNHTKCTNRACHTPVFMIETGKSVGLKPGGITRTSRTPTLVILILPVSSLLAKRQESRMGGRGEIRVRYTCSCWFVRSRRRFVVVTFFPPRLVISIYSLSKILIA